MHDASYPALFTNSIDLATMIKLVQRGDFERLRFRGRDAVLPAPSKYMGELVKGVFRPETVDAIVLGSTELPLILRDANAPLPLLDTTMIHVKKFVTEMLGEDA